MTHNNEIRDVVFDNYEDIRATLINKYNKYGDVRRENEGIFYGDINKQFLDSIHKDIIEFICNRSMSNLDDIIVYVEDKFTWDNVERIISKDGEI